MTPFGRIAMTHRPERAVVERLGDEITAFNLATTDIHDGVELYAAVRDEQRHRHLLMRRRLSTEATSRRPASRPPSAGGGSSLAVG